MPCISKHFVVLCFLFFSACTPRGTETLPENTPPPTLPTTEVPAATDPVLQTPPPAAATLSDSLARSRNPLPIPRPAPDVTMTTLTGKTIRLDDGSMVLLNFWATWCGPCIAEMPDLEALYQELKDDGFTVIGVSIDEEGADVVKPFIEEMGVSYPIVVDDGTIVDAFGGIPGLPTTFLIDPQAQILNRFIGFFPTDEMRLPIRDMMGLPLE